MIRVFLVDDSAAMRKRLVELCNDIPNVEVVGTAPAAAEAAALLLLYRPDVLILDIHLGRQTGFDLLKLIVPALPGITVMMISGGELKPYRAAAAVYPSCQLFDKSRDMGRLQQELVELATACG